jgi:hypothetical protein
MKTLQLVDILMYKMHCCGSGSAWLRIDFSQLDPDPGGKNYQEKIEKS